MYYPCEKFGDDKSSVFVLTCVYMHIYTDNFRAAERHAHAGDYVRVSNNVGLSRLATAIDSDDDGVCRSSYESNTDVFSLLHGCFSN